MHPRVFLDGYWRSDLRPDIFVAMPFPEEFRLRWDQIYRPAISEPPIGLRPIRVDESKSGDSILTEIIDGVAHSQLILADISVTNRWEDGPTKRFCRNANVMYEVGLAIACRQPCEVLLVRDDSDQLLFDASHLPVMRVDFNDQHAARGSIQQAITDRLLERDKLKDIRVQKILDQLSQFEVNLIRVNGHLQAFGWKGPSYPADVVMALPRLLDKGIVRLAMASTSTQPDAYTWTTFGRTVADKLLSAV